MNCEHCGKELKEDARFCSRCGEGVEVQDELMADLSNPDAASTTQEDHTEESAVKEEIADDLTNQEKVSLFIGDNENYFLRKWQQKSSWNWAGFFLTFYWLGYRKLYKPLFITLGAYMAVATILFFILPIELYFLNFLFGIFVCFYIGMNGNTLYKNKLNQKLAEIDTIASSKQEKIERIRGAGGTSVGGVFAPMGILMVWEIIVAVFLLKPYYEEFFHPSGLVFGTGTYDYGIEEEKDTFSIDETIIMDIYLDEPAGTDELHFVVLKKGDDDEYYTYDHWNSDVNPSWDYFYTEISYDFAGFNGYRTGEYLVQVEHENDVLAEGKFSVVLTEPYLNTFARSPYIVFGTGTYDNGIEVEKDTFTVDDTIIMDVYLDEPVGAVEVQFVFLKKGEDGKYYTYDNWYSEVDPSWDYFYNEITYDYEGFNGFRAGEYIVEVRQKSEVLAEGSFTVEE